MKFLDCLAVFGESRSRRLVALLPQQLPPIDQQGLQDMAKKYTSHIRGKPQVSSLGRGQGSAQKYVDVLMPQLARCQ